MQIFQKTSKLINYKINRTSQSIKRKKTVKILQKKCKKKIQLNKFNEKKVNKKLN